MKNKKIYMVLLTALLGMATASAYELAAKNSDGVTIYYDYVFSGSVVDLAVTSNESDKYKGTVKIPDKVALNGNTYKVYCIKTGAFKGCTSLTSVTIPNSVTLLEDYVFEGCSSLKSVILPSTVLRVGKGCFKECSYMTTVSYPTTLTSIPAETFYGCSSLTAFGISGNVQSIGENAFKNCTSLKSITIPNSVKSVDAGIFDGCVALKTITLSNSIKTIPKNAFRYCRSISAITIPKSVTSIGTSAFSNCTNMTSVTFPNTLTTIDENAFAGCTTIMSIDIPSSVTVIKTGAFTGCSSLESVGWPTAIKVIKANMFKDCAKLSDFNFKNVTEIEISAFENCGFTSIFMAEDPLKKIGEKAFYKCKNLKRVAFNSSEIGKGAFQECGFEELEIDSHVTKIGQYAFSNCDNLKRVKIASETIDEYAFSNCSQLSEVYLDKGVSYLNRGAFYKNSIKKLNIVGPIKKICLDALTGLNLDYFELPIFEIFEYPSLAGKINVLKLAEGYSYLPFSLVYGVRMNKLISPRMTPPTLCFDGGPYASYNVFVEIYKQIDVYVLNTYLPAYQKAWGPYMKSITGVDDLSGVDDAIADSEDEADNADAPYYDLMGRRVANPGPGIYIHAGKKVIIK